MIGHLSGKLLEKKLPHLLLEVGGVGYELEVPMPTFVALPQKGEPVSLFTHFVVRETAQLLFGFSGRNERDLFRLLINVSGVGPKLGLMILSGMMAADFRQCVAEQNIELLVQLPGVGRKTAERLLVEVRDRLPPAEREGMEDTADPSAFVSVQKEAENALQALGYTAKQSSQVVSRVWRSDMSLEQVIMKALKKMLK